MNSRSTENLATGQKEYGLLQQVSHFFMQKHKREQNQQNYKQHPKTVKIYTIGMEEHNILSNILINIVHNI